MQDSQINPMISPENNQLVNQFTNANVLEPEIKTVETPVQEETSQNATKVIGGGSGGLGQFPTIIEEGSVEGAGS